MWPTLNFHGDPGSCPFNTKRRDKLEKLRTEVKENREGIQPVKQEQVKSNVHFASGKIFMGAMKCNITIAYTFRIEK